MLETLHPGGIKVRSYSADVVHIYQGNWTLTIETDVLAAIADLHGERREVE
jgi:hypothetical protein